MNWAILLECELCGMRFVAARVPNPLAKGCPSCHPADPAHREMADCMIEGHAHAREAIECGDGRRFIDGRIRLANPGRPC